MKRFTVFFAGFLFCSVCLAGEWGPGSFDNDDALDWSHLCTDSKGSAVIVAALKTAMQPGALQSPDGAAAVAAAELVAAAKGKPGKALPKELGDWLNHQSRQELAKLAPAAKDALARVKDARVSELAQLWKESADKQWRNTISELESRLK